MSPPASMPGPETRPAWRRRRFFEALHLLGFSIVRQPRSWDSRGHHTRHNSDAVASPEVAGAGESEKRKKPRGPMPGMGCLRHASADDDKKGCDTSNNGFLRGFPSWVVPRGASRQQTRIPQERAQTLAPARPAAGWGAGKQGRQRGCLPPRIPGCRALQRATPENQGHRWGEH